MATDFCKDTFCASLQAMSTEEIKSLPLETRLELLANTYRAVTDYLNSKTDRAGLRAEVKADGFAEVEQDSEILRRQAALLNDNERAELADIFRLQEKFHFAIPLPDLYMRNLEEVHLSVLNDIRTDEQMNTLLTRWAGFQSNPENIPEWDMDTGLMTEDFAQKLEDTGIGFEDRIAFIQFIADRQAFHWKRIEPELFADFEPMQVRPFRHAEAPSCIRRAENSMITHSNLTPQNRKDLQLPEQDSSPYAASCIVTDLNGKFAEFFACAGFAAHEPQHTVQSYLKAKCDEGVITEGHPYYEASKIFSFREDHGTGSAPPGLFRKRGDSCPPQETLFKAAFEAYLSVPHERASFFMDEESSLATSFYYAPDLGPLIQNVVPDFDRMNHAVVAPEDQDSYRGWYEKAYKNIPQEKRERIELTRSRATGAPELTA